MNGNVLFEIKDLQKKFGSLTVFDGLSETICKGDVVVIIGPSGGGKSTMLRCATLLETMDSGTLAYGENVAAREENGKSVYAGKAALAQVRRQFGLVFQQFDLFPHYTVLKNVCFPMEISGVKRADAEKRARELLELVGLPDKAEAYPAQLSGGQQQRVAIARALATDPKVLLCDEATSALDPNTTHAILTLIKDINKKLGITVVVITHQMSVVKEICTHVAILDDGEVVEDGMVSTVFSAPRSQAARHLVFPGGADAAVSDPSQERRIRLIFRSAQTTAIPMVARLAAEESIYANVISASTQKLSEEIYGSMLLGVPRGQLDRAMGFFRSIPNLQAEEVSVDVH